VIKAQLRCAGWGGGGGEAKNVANLESKVKGWLTRCTAELDHKKSWRTSKLPIGAQRGQAIGAAGLVD
jgi:hypothetical protein